MASSMFLYWGSGSPPCWRAMIALEEKGFGGYPNKLVSFANKEHKSEEIKKINPRGQVPTFKHGDLVVNESYAIVDYLESSFPDQGTRLIPVDAAKRATVLQRKYEANNLHKIAVEEYVAKLLYKPDSLSQEDKETKKKALQDELGVWEQILSGVGEDTFLASSEFTVADIAFFPTLAFLVRMGLKLDKFPRLGAYFEKTKKRPSIESSWPPHWKETPNQNKLEDV